MALLQIYNCSLPNPGKTTKSPRNPCKSLILARNAAKIPNSAQILRPRLSNAPKAAALMRKGASWRELLLPVAMASWPLTSSAAEAGGKVSIESIVVAIDDFNNRNPFFVAGVVFVWLVVIPLAQEYLRKCKAVGAIDAFRKLRDVPEAQLLDIRRGKSVQFMGSPNLKFLGKSAVHVEFEEDNEDGFVRAVLQRFPDTANTVVCVLDNFDGNSLKVAELLFNNSFKEAYAIRGGLRGPEGWQEVQEKYFPPSVHVFPRKKKSKKLTHTDVNSDRTDEQDAVNGKATASPHSSLSNKSNGVEEHHEKPNNSTSANKQTTARPLSPYPNFHDLKPPSSPSPSKPEM